MDSVLEDLFLRNVASFSVDLFEDRSQMTKNYGMKYFVALTAKNGYFSSFCNKNANMV